MSTDFDIADKLYFEPLTPEDVENVVRLEKPDGAVVQFGGQTAIKLTEALMKMGVPILGTSAENVNAAEDRELFDKILEECSIPRPAGDTVYTAEEAKKVANAWDIPFWCGLPMCWEARACRSPLTIRMWMSLSVLLTGSLRSIRSWWINT